MHICTQFLFSKICIYVCAILFKYFSYEMMKSTWHEEPEKRPPFADVVKFLHEQNIEDTPIEEAGGTVVDAESDSGYLDVFQAQTTL